MIPGVNLQISDHESFLHGNLLFYNEDPVMPHLKILNIHAIIGRIAGRCPEDSYQSRSIKNNRIVARILAPAGRQMVIDK